MRNEGQHGRPYVTRKKQRTEEFFTILDLEIRQAQLTPGDAGRLDLGEGSPRSPMPVAEEPPHSSAAIAAF